VAGTLTARHDSPGERLVSNGDAYPAWRFNARETRMFIDEYAYPHKARTNL
jgi:hypothetical protein